MASVQLSLAELWQTHEAVATDPTSSRHAGTWGALAEIDQIIERRAHLAARAAEIDRPRHVVALIGEPPPSLPGRHRWLAAAAAIESYEARWSTSAGELVDDRAPADQLQHLAHVQEEIAACRVAAPAELGADLA